MRWKLSRQEEKLDELFRSFQTIQDEEIRAYLSKFLCIRASGFVEASFKNLIIDYCQGSSPKSLQKFISSKLKGTTNLSYGRLLSVLNSFDNDWAHDFEQLVNEEQISALNSVISNRNNIAHGENDAISYETMKNYYKSIKEIVGYLKEIIKKN